MNDFQQNSCLPHCKVLPTPPPASFLPSQGWWRRRVTQSKFQSDTCRTPTLLFPGSPKHRLLRPAATMSCHYHVRVSLPSMPELELCWPWSLSYPPGPGADDARALHSCIHRRGPSLSTTMVPCLDTFPVPSLGAERLHLGCTHVQRKLSSGTATLVKINYRQPPGCCFTLPDTSHRHTMQSTRSRLFPETSS